MEDAVLALIIVPVLFIGLPWLIFHYVTKWKQARVLTGDDEKLLDDLYEAARRLDDRLMTIERIMAADNPEWKRNTLPHRASETRLLDQIDALEAEARIGDRSRIK